MSKDVVGLGSLNLDVLYRMEDPVHLVKTGWPVVPGGEVFLADEHLAPLEEFLAIQAGCIGRSGGGSAANTVFALARMGFATGFLGVVGNDPAGLYLRETLAPVDTAGIKTIPGRSGTCVIILDRRAERTLVAFPQANARFEVDDKALDMARTARIVHFSSLADRRARQAQADAVRSLPREVRVSFDPGEIYARDGIEAIEPLLRRSFIVFFNDRELEMLTQTTDLRQGARRILDFGPAIVVCKRGLKGSYILSREQEIEEAAVRVGAVDTTGAGDVFAAGFLAGMLLNLPLGTTAGMAAAAAARSVTARGRENYPDAGFLKDWVRSAHLD